jgi:hypothetical protein
MSVSKITGTGAGDSDRGDGPVAVATRPSVIARIGSRAGVHVIIMRKAHLGWIEI